MKKPAPSFGPYQPSARPINPPVHNGFARTEVTQVFFNPNPTDLEAIYSFPVPTSASLAELTIWSGDKTLEGEVVEAAEARKVYEEERDSGNDAGLGECSCTKKKCANSGLRDETRKNQGAAMARKSAAPGTRRRRRMSDASRLRRT